MATKIHREPTKRYTFRMDPDYRAPDGSYPYAGAITTAAAYTERQRAKAIAKLRELPGLQWVRAA